MMRAIASETLQMIWADILMSELPLSVNVSHIVTDSRKINDNAVFFAIKGENFDGNDFIASVLSSGVAWAIGEKPIIELSEQVRSRYIQVSDTRLALGLIAKWIRQQFNGITFGLTGSSGKTTTKEMLASICRQNGSAYATKGNLNNDLGVPFTWFELPENIDYAVIEMGASHQKEITYLSDISNPDIALVTNAGQAHLEGFGGIEGVAKGKGELYDHLMSGQIAVINADDTYADFWLSRLDKGVIIYLFGMNEQNIMRLSQQYSIDIDHCVWSTHQDLQNNCFEFSYQKNKSNITLPIQGIHNVSNALGAMACALAAHFSLESVIKGLTQFSLPSGRLQTTVIDNLTIIDDSYNANPNSVEASARILSDMEGYRVMVLGDMGELGDASWQLHLSLGEKLVACADQFFCLGKDMEAFANKNHKATHFNNYKELLSELVSTIDHQFNEKKITVLVKGSRSMRMEDIANHLQKKYGNH